MGMGEVAPTKRVSVAKPDDPATVSSVQTSVFEEGTRLDTKDSEVSAEDFQVGRARCYTEAG